MADPISVFLKAAKAGNLEKVIEYLDNHIVDVNSCNSRGLTALHSASDTDVVRELIKRGADVMATTQKGNTPLHINCLAGNEDIVRILIQHNADVNKQSLGGFSPLYMAAQENHQSIVRLLLANGANQNLATTEGFTPLAVAMQQGHDQVASILLGHGTRGKIRFPVTSESGRSLLHIAAKKDDCAAAALLLQSNISPDVTSKNSLWTALHVACHYGNENIARLLIERQADINAAAKQNITPLHVAARWGHRHMVQLLLDYGAKIDAKTTTSMTPTHVASRNGHEAVVDLLITRGAPLSARTRSGLVPLHLAAQGDHHDVARVLLHHRAPVDEITNEHITPLHVASHCGHVRVAKLLLDHNADPNFRALNQFTSLHIACKKNRLAIVELLLRYGAQLNAVTESGLTGLMVAAFMGHIEIVLFLLRQQGADCEAATVRGETALLLAVRANQLDVVSALLRHGAALDARTRESQNALHIAARLNYPEMADLLLRQGNAPVDATTRELYQPLAIAAKEGHEQVARVLLAHGANIECSTRNHQFRPLHLASKYGHVGMCQLLLDSGAQLDAQGKNQVTPLMVATHYDQLAVAQLLLARGASPHSVALNRYTSLHIAAKNNRLDIARALLAHQADVNSQSKAKFRPLHLAAKEGHQEMVALLIGHGADINCRARNGIAPIHLCAEGGHVPVAQLLFKPSTHRSISGGGGDGNSASAGADLDAQTKGGYSALMIAAFFGQPSMAQFLLANGCQVNLRSASNHTALHLASQQNHHDIVQLLLRYHAEPDVLTDNQQTALSIAQNLGHVSIVDTLRVVTETVVKTTTKTITEEKFKLVAPETMQETFDSDSEDEATEDTKAHAESVKFLTTDHMKGLMTEQPGHAMDARRDDDMSQDMTYLSNVEQAPLDAGESTIGVADYAPLATGSYRQQVIINDQQQPLDLELERLSPDNVDLDDDGTRGPPVHAGFLVSFMVDARGGAMRGCRHSGVRVIIPPKTAQQPMRITCRYLRKEKLVHPPPLMEGEACASKIMEVGPSGAKFLGPVLIEVPHFASLRGREREIIILRSENGEVWREHLVDQSSDDATIANIMSQLKQYDNENNAVANDNENIDPSAATISDSNNRITRIVTNEFPKYFAIITRVRQQVHVVGTEGGTITSNIEPKVQAIFPEGALTKRIKVGLQVQQVPAQLASNLFGKRVIFSPIVTIEPRRRKFHCAIQLKIPVPDDGSNASVEQGAGLRLLCSITGGTALAQWEDVTGSTPLTLVDSCLLFTTTVSARFWLLDARTMQAANYATKYASELYRHLISVPFMASFVVFAKRRDLNQANVRVFCMTDDREDKTLESQEHYVEVAKSRQVEVLEHREIHLEFAANLRPLNDAMISPYTGHPPVLVFRAFCENRLELLVSVKDVGQQAVGRIAFLQSELESVASHKQPLLLRPICNLNIELPAMVVNYDDILGTPKRNSQLASARVGQLSLADISSLLDEDEDEPQSDQNGTNGHSITDSIGPRADAEWMTLAWRLGIPRDEVEFIRDQCDSQRRDVYEQRRRETASPSLVLLMHWYRLATPETRDQELGRALIGIGRQDITNRLGFPIEPRKISRSTLELMREIQLIPVRSSDNIYENVTGGARYLQPPGVPADKRSDYMETNISNQGDMSANVNMKEWTQEQDGALFHIVEQTATMTSGVDGNQREPPASRRPLSRRNLVG